jgi:hypothetical protein
MKVFDLCCSRSHRFEGWFASEDEFLDQRARQFIACPLCNDDRIERVPSAARLNLATSRAEANSVTGAGQGGPVSPAGGSAGADGTMTVAAAGVDLQALWMQAVRHVLANTEDVGDRFADEARDIHYGRGEHRGIRGHATPDVAAELREEGIEVHSIPIPAALKGPVQ